MGMLKIECERRVEDRQKDARCWKWMEQWNVLKLDAQMWNKSGGCNRMLKIECALALIIGCMDGRKEHAGGGG
jgi:hypothetical protein